MDTIRATSDDYLMEWWLRRRNDGTIMHDVVTPLKDMKDDELNTIVDKLTTPPPDDHTTGSSMSVKVEK